ncbi:MAG: hypothetical protein ABIZ04_15770 [Opitutus sp.]
MKSPPDCRTLSRLGLAALGSVLALTGCTTAGRVASDLGLAGAGGVVGYKLSDGKAGGAAAGAAAGYLASNLAQNKVQRALIDAEQRGFDRAMNQAVKQQYWVIQNQQRSRVAPESTPARYVPVQLPESKIDGVIHKSSVEYLRVEP